MSEFAMSGELEKTVERKRNKTKVDKPEPESLWGDEPDYPPVGADKLKSVLLAVFIGDRDGGLSETRSRLYSQSDGWMNWQAAAIRIVPSVSDAPFLSPDTRHCQNAAWYYVEDTLKALVRDGVLAAATAPVYRRMGVGNRYTGGDYDEYVGEEVVYGLPGTPPRKERESPVHVRS